MRSTILKKVAPNDAMTLMPTASLSVAPTSLSASGPRGRGSMVSMEEETVVRTGSMDIDLNMAVKKIKAHQNKLANRVVDDLELMLAAQQKSIVEAVVKIMQMTSAPASRGWGQSEGVALPALAVAAPSRVVLPPVPDSGELDLLEHCEPSPAGDGAHPSEDVRETAAVTSTGDRPVPSPARTSTSPSKTKFSDSQSFWLRARATPKLGSSGPHGTVCSDDDSTAPPAPSVCFQAKSKEQSKDVEVAPQAGRGQHDAAAHERALADAAEHGTLLPFSLPPPSVASPPVRLSSAAPRGVAAELSPGKFGRQDTWQEVKKDRSLFFALATAPDESPHPSEDDFDEADEKIRYDADEKIKRARSLAADHRLTAEFYFSEDDTAGFLKRFARSVQFELLAGSVLVTNAMMLGVQVEVQHANAPKQVDAFFQALNVIYMAFFALELALRINAASVREFWVSGDWQWAWFDTIVTLTTILEVIFDLVSSRGKEASLSFARLLRIIRVLRVIRLFGLVRWCRPLRLLISAIFVTFKSVGWALLLLAMIMYIFAIIFTVNVRDFASGEIDFGDARLMRYYGTIPRSILTLFKTIFGGLDWETCHAPLADISWALTILFLVYVIFVNLAVMNVIQGLFLSSAIEQAQSDEEMMVATRLQAKHSLEQRLRNLFMQLSSSSHGTLTLKEFEMHLKDENMKAFLDSFDIHADDAWTLFKMLDADGGGFVDLNEFVDGCIRLKGSAKSIQVAELGYHDKWIMDKLIDLSEFCKDHFDELAHKLDMATKLSEKKLCIDTGSRSGKRRTSFARLTESSPVGRAESCTATPRDEASPPA